MAWSRRRTRLQRFRSSGSGRSPRTSTPSAIRLASPSGSSSVKQRGRSSLPLTMMRDRRRFSLVVARRERDSPAGIRALRGDDEVAIQHLPIALEECAEAREHAAQLRGTVERKVTRFAAFALDRDVLAPQLGDLPVGRVDASYQRAVLPMLEVGRQPRSASRAGSSSAPRRSSSCRAPGAPGRASSASRSGSAACSGHREASVRPRRQADDRSRSHRS